MITGIIGPMFSGKSSEMLRLADRKHIAGKKTLLIRPEKDSRNFIARNHSGNLDYIDTVEIVDDFMNEARLQGWVNEYDAIFVDEFWMIKNNIVLCKMLPTNGSKTDIYFCGIWANVNQELWPEAISIIPWFDETKYLPAICMDCHSEHATHNVRIDGNKKVATDIGAGVGDSEYKVVCRKCYIERYL